ncbi:hypothetical protein HX063_16120 [Myroides odoratimimus]|uniref:hypothetical protein n=1 Tax=Myroides odoratimimus TaxID=76832 RepID=UPI002575881E|nr:hypothetical protein [Myroides odoratimimus]MDM1496908.1 hypothetical protein [Myroides odoratimimus]MDM1529977.1 hypothetical protein [Myroides odoratimimus]
MAQPVGLLSKIKITDTNYKAFFKTKAVTVISEEMYDCVHYNYQDHYFYQYNKKKEELLCLAFYNHGNRETLIGNFYQSIKEVVLLALDHSFIALTLDAFNWTEVDTYEVLEEDVWNIKQITKEELAIVQSIALTCSEQFDQPFVEKLFNSKIVDSNVVKKVSALQEKHRLANLTTFAKEATPLRPIHLFGNYYYNGKAVFSCKSGGHIYTDIDLATFKPTVYGAADAEHVLFLDKCIKTNPKKFKRVAKYETVYYLSEEGVLDEKGVWIEGSDATTFKLKEDYLAEDSINLYYWGNVVSKSSFSTYRVESYPYQTDFLITDTAVYYTQYKLEVDAQSFRFLKRLEGLAYSYTGFVGEDKEGLFVYLIEENKGQVIRSTGLSIDQLLQLFQDKYGNKYWRMEEDERICLEKPSATYYKEFAKKCKTPWVFYQIKELRDYAKLIVQKYEDKKDEEELIPFWKIYSLVEPYLWIEADSYKYVTLMYCIEGKQEHALDTLRKAIMYGAFDVMEFFDHPLLSTIQEHEYFLELKEYATQNKPIGYKIPMQLEILEKLLALPQSMYTDGTILWKYHLYDNVDIEEAMREHPQLTDYYTRYITLNTEMFNRFFKRHNLIDMDYTPYEEYHCMPIEASIIMLKYYMRMADIPSGSVAYFIPQLIQRMDKIKERINRLEGEEYTHYQIVYNNNEVVQILEQYF